MKEGLLYHSGQAGTTPRSRNFVPLRGDWEEVISPGELVCQLEFAHLDTGDECPVLILEETGEAFPIIGRNFLGIGDGLFENDLASPEDLSLNRTLGRTQVFSLDMHRLSFNREVFVYAGDRVVRPLSSRTVFRGSFFYGRFYIRRVNRSRGGTGQGSPGKQ